jgi:hypothetical protein
VFSDLREIFLIIRVHKVGILYKVYEGRTKHTVIKNPAVSLDEKVIKLSEDVCVVHTTLLFNHNTTVRGEQSSTG